MTKVIVSAAISIMLFGCAGQEVSPEKQAFAQATVPTCETDRECELKWAASRKWILENAAYKLKTVTPDYIETYGAMGGSSLIAARASKEPRKSGGYRIVVGVSCDNMFGCNPDAWDAAISFNKFVTDSF